MFERRRAVSRKIAADARMGVSSGYVTAVHGLLPNVYGGERPVRCVLQTFDAQLGDFTPLLTVNIQKLIQLEHVEEAQVRHELQRAVVQPGTPPAPLVALALPTSPDRPYTDLVRPTHVMALAATVDGSNHIQRLYGNQVFFVPHMNPLWALANECEATLRDNDDNRDVMALVVPHFGVIVNGRTPEQVYKRLQHMEQEATQYVERWGKLDNSTPNGASFDRLSIARTRFRLSKEADQPLVATTSAPPTATSAEEMPAALGVWPQDAPLTQQTAYTHLEEAPAGSRVIYAPGQGLMALGEQPETARRALDIAHQALRIITVANAFSRYTPLPAATPEPDDDQPPRPYQGEVVLVTGATSAVGRLCVEVFLERGAAVVGVDDDPAVVNLAAGAAYLGLAEDTTQSSAVERVLDACVRRFGGLDVAVVNRADVGNNAADETDSTLMLKAVYPLMRLSPRGGRMMMNGSPHETAVGSGLTALTRLTAMAWDTKRIRVNRLQPQTLLQTEAPPKEAVHVDSRHLAEMIADLCGEHFRGVAALRLGRVD